MNVKYKIEYRKWKMLLKLRKYKCTVKIYYVIEMKNLTPSDHVGILHRQRSRAYTVRER